MKKTTLFVAIVATLPLAFFSACSEKKPVVLPPNPQEHKISSYDNWDFGAKAYQHTANIIKIGPRPIESVGHKKTQDYITKQLNQCGWAVRKQSFKVKTPLGMRGFTNLIGRRVNGTEPKILLAAHFDSKMIDGFVGADDAASSVAALLEIAENLPKQDPALAGSIELVFFDGEESLKRENDIKPGVDGFYGSEYYAEALNNDLDGEKKFYKKRPAFGILLDMIGHKNLSIRIPSDTPYALLKSYFDVVDKHGLEYPFGVSRAPIGDDHLALNNVAKVPTIDIIGDFPRKSWWHTTNDNMDIISQRSLSTSIQFTLELINSHLKKIK